MHAEQLDQLSARHAVFVTTAMQMQHPGNDYKRWRHDWAEINRLVEEINRMVSLQARPPV
jgi:gentisate 1,2-dioxygenase